MTRRPLAVGINAIDPNHSYSQKVKTNESTIKECKTAVSSAETALKKELRQKHWNTRYINELFNPGGEDECDEWENEIQGLLGLRNKYPEFKTLCDTIIDNLYRIIDAQQTILILKKDQKEATKELWHHQEKIRLATGRQPVIK